MAFLAFNRSRNMDDGPVNRRFSWCHQVALKLCLRDKALAWNRVTEIGKAVSVRAVYVGSPVIPSLIALPPCQRSNAAMVGGVWLAKDSTTTAATPARFMSWSATPGAAAGGAPPRSAAPSAAIYRQPRPSSGRSSASPRQAAQ